jgi:hypothetical protein
MSIPARWSLLSASLAVVTVNLARAIWVDQDVGWSLACFIVALVASVFVAVYDFIDFSRREKDK